MSTLHGSAGCFDDEQASSSSSGGAEISCCGAYRVRNANATSRKLGLRVYDDDGRV
jgi:hypothetical protein